MSVHTNVGSHERARHTEPPHVRHVGPEAQIYVACPLRTYDTVRYHQLLTLIRQRFEGGHILEARTLFSSNTDWRRKWPHLVGTLTHLVFFAESTGHIGRGVWTEIEDARRELVAIRHIADDGTLTPLDHITFTGRDEKNWQRYCRVVLAGGRP